MISIYLASTLREVSYRHIGKGLYYGSYRAPRVLLWSIGVIIFLVMMGTNLLRNEFLVNFKFLNDFYFIYFTLSPVALSTLKLGNITPQLIIDNVRNTKERSNLKSKVEGKAAVYAMVNNINGKMYIGSAISHYVHNGFKKHSIPGSSKNLDGNSYFIAEKKKYGIENFSLQIYDLFFHIPVNRNSSDYQD